VRITLLAHGLRGDVWPMVALGWHLAARDHDVTVAAPGEYRAFVERAGLRAMPVPFDMQTWLATTDGQRVLHAGGASLMRGLQREYARHAAALDDAFVAAAEGAEALVAMHLTWDRAQALGDLLQIPLAIVYPLPVSRSGDYASLVLTRGRLRPRPLRRASHDLTTRIWSHGAAKATQAFRRRLGVPPSSQPTQHRQAHPGALGLHTVSRHLFPRPADWPDTLKLTGAWEMPSMLRDDLGEAVPAPLQDWLDDGPPPIFLGFGSMPVLDPAALLHDILAVTASLGRRAVLSANCVPQDALDTLPDHLRVVGAIDHDRLFPRCAAIVHHGGAGSTHASARAGRPTMVCSVFGDQPWWGEQLRRMGVGTHVPFRKLDRSALADGLRTILEPGVAERASALGTAMAAEGDGLPAATRLLEDWLVTAEPTPLLKRPTARPSKGRAVVTTKF
jgi:sterol 3beta-glucosyltransferase